MSDHEINKKKTGREQCARVGVGDLTALNKPRLQWKHYKETAKFGLNSAKLSFKPTQSFHKNKNVLPMCDVGYTTVSRSTVKGKVLMYIQAAI